MCDNILNKSIENIKGVGEARLRQLSVLGINTIHDAITYYPRGHEDRSVVKKICDLKQDDNCSFIGTISSSIQELRTRSLTIYKVKVDDGTGSILLVFFNQHYIKKILTLGRTFIFFGNIEKNGGRLQVQNPVFEAYTKNNLQKATSIVPIYNLTYGLSQTVLRGIINRALEVGLDSIKEFMPQEILHEKRLESLCYSMQNIHMPQTKEHFKKARNRLVFDEFFLLQLALFNIKKTNDICNNNLKIIEHESCREFIEKLPFKLTNAQMRTIKEVFFDMQSDKIMNRLIQGDVGSGKTIVAIIALLNAVKNGYQGIMLAPTEILARQHEETLNSFLKPFEIEVGLLVGSMKKKEKNRLLDRIQLGKINIVVGTHAILQESVIFDNVGLVITDEQHRFGVKQRATLAKKGNTPHVLAMSATPIPRTLALILYGDLDISIIDELPPERKKVTTRVISEDKKERMNNFIRQKVKEGRQCYVVCPLVEDSESIEAKAVNSLAKKLAEEDFKDLRVALIHGKLRSSKKDEIMEEFKNGNIDILISTTVIEVGVNVPNASIMVIEHAERFGLSTLHQLRGRVGRGDKEAFCILVTENKGKVNNERMKIMKNTNDGFIISKKDLELRGIGDFFGTRQHGIPDLKIANIYEDIAILKEAQSVAQDIMEKDNFLEKHPILKEEVEKRFLNKLKEDIVLN